MNDGCFYKKDCIFCKITNGEIPSKKVYENATVLAFEDISPQAPVHVIVIPKQHIANLEELDESNAHVMKDITLAAKEVARIKNVNKAGYRLINNCGKQGGQTVYHLHFHLLGGMDLSEKMV